MTNDAQPGVVLASSPAPATTFACKLDGTPIVPVPHAARAPPTPRTAMAPHTLTGHRRPTNEPATRTPTPVVPHLHRRHERLPEVTLAVRARSHPGAFPAPPSPFDSARQRGDARLVRARRRRIREVRGGHPGDSLAPAGDISSAPAPRTPRATSIFAGRVPLHRGQRRAGRCARARRDDGVPRSPARRSPAPTPTPTG